MEFADRENYLNANIVKFAEESFPDDLGLQWIVHGFDHNYEYRIYGNFSTGDPIYDPNSDLILPEFILRDYELISTNPGFLFRPDERYLPSALPPVYPGRGQEVAR
jgi:hypothetical protein